MICWVEFSGEGEDRLIPVERFREIEVLRAHDTGPRFSIGIADKMDSKSLSLRFFSGFVEKDENVIDVCRAHTPGILFGEKIHAVVGMQRKISILEKIGFQ